MAPRFNKEPINLIHRIPSQKQIDEARPVATPYGQILLNAGSLCWRKVVDLFAYVTRYEDETHPRIRKPLALPDRTMEHTTVQGQGSVQSNGMEKSIQEVESPVTAKVTILPQPSPAPTGQSEEVAELRACMIGQQDEIARLTSHIQELASLVTSQQEVLVHLGKELEAGTFSPVSTSTAAAALKRSRIGRKKPTVGETPNSPQEHEHPFPPQENGESQSIHL
ncbi:hypothetical protein [Candidatus Nitrospira nitrificans]|uniref:Uncharacterized protein n=1 Tax=Candidatus Nitrospira nitrificans TaxID=1742973 RepID=A0A0S4LHL0_9BACT|nr:hypothetical protein [Candidatus Nitrospira nitrificans]CUS36997.1 hypothetical protein COMA2_30024 [Candidatus Nitrospira nitrificans]